MTTYNTGRFDQKISQNYMSEFAVFCRAAWKSADSMADDLAAAGIPRSRATCISYRNGQSEPRITLGNAIEAIGEYRLEQEILTRRARLEQRRSRKRE